jgi:single-strand DNA-binding protein
MSGSVNKVILLGNLGKDPKISATPNGDKVASFSLATSEKWTDKGTGEKQERTEWHNVVVYNENLVRLVEQYIRKGSKVYLEGKLQTRKWQDKNGVEKYTTEIVLARFKGEITIISSNNREAGSDDAAAQTTQQGNYAAAKNNPPADAGLDYDAPF